MNKRELKRQIKLRLEVIKHAKEVTGNISKTCRYFGISRQIFYKWKDRYKEHGEIGLSDQSKRPHTSPRSTPSDIVSKILYLRKNYHFGPERISHYLCRYHGIKVAQSSVHRILQLHNLNKLLHHRRKYERQKNQWKRYEKQQPGHRVQIDVKFLERIPKTSKRFYQFTTIDDCTSVQWWGGRENMIGFKTLKQVQGSTKTCCYRQTITTYILL